MSGLVLSRLQAKGPRWYSWLVPICISLLVVCGIESVLMSQAASTDKRGELHNGCPIVPCPELLVQLSEAQKSGPETVVPLPEVPKSGLEMVVPETQKSGREVNVGAVGTPQLVLPADVANKVGHKIWINETRGDRFDREKTASAFPQ